MDVCPGSQYSILIFKLQIDMLSYMFNLYDIIRIFYLISEFENMISFSFNGNFSFNYRYNYINPSFLKNALNSTSVPSFLKHSSFSFGDKEKMAILRGHKSHELSQLARLSSSGVSESVVYICSINWLLNHVIYL